MLAAERIRNRQAGSNHDNPRRRYLVLTKKEILHKMAEGLISQRHLPRIDLGQMLSKQRFRIRLYKATDRIIPKLNQILRIGLGIMPATNFPPLTARFLYERFTEHIADQDRIVVYDPCSGWGGRILGAMATRSYYCLCATGHPSILASAAPQRASLNSP